MNATRTASETLSLRQQSIIPIAAFAAAGDIARLNTALEQGLDAGLTIDDHLFGDVFERDNLDWPSRELATVGMLSALAGAESQLQSHMRISMNVGTPRPNSTC
ncbi:MAG TPA: carboxymuconolactone decarboxylase family protein [Variovorax sp.]|nr:carboxymuconolactone decarboxylase family protein [Variovorax sp.]